MRLGCLPFLVARPTCTVGYLYGPTVEQLASLHTRHDALKIWGTPQTLAPARPGCAILRQLAWLFRD